MADGIVFSIPMTHRFRGITNREGMLIRGSVSWAEWSPFPEYSVPEASRWLLAARQAADHEWPCPVRTSIPVNVTIPAVDPDTAHTMTRESRCGTAKVKVAEPGQTLAEDCARVEAVRDALGPDGRIRVDANGAWDLDQAEKALRELGRFDLEYAEQPCACVDDLAVLRKRTSVLIAADESIRKAEDPYLVKSLEAADVIVLKVQPLGGVRACLRLAEDLGIPVVVSSALETSVGLRAGLALAAALPELPYACGLNTASLLSHDLVSDPLVAVNGVIEVREVHLNLPSMDPVSTHSDWRSRLEQCESYCVEMEQ